MNIDQGMQMFNLMNMLIPILILIIFGIILFSFIRSIKEWNSNNKQPRLQSSVSVVSKRTKVSGGGPNSRTSTRYFITFQFESGERAEFKVNGREYGQLAEGDRGELTFQGTRYLRFTRSQTSA
ncbi:DUF2500 domain-containing protein [Neobacillus dielmonensis]|uniref:DUF2500 domain-containing protein n=1 Tax=Neobacillus dielmonensis TaxID=1347369 RepID=UPI00069441A6|nr:DUF2500 domain-containing protein [Neobacillus dielmonensis]